MSMTTTTHTPATLAALPPRELDALAHAAAMQRLYVLWHGIPLDCDKDGISGDPIPAYSTDLNAAALLEAELARRGLKDAYVISVEEVLYARPVEIRNAVDITNPYLQPFLWLTLSAKARTIAAILAAQEAR